MTHPTAKEPCKNPWTTLGRGIRLAQVFHAVSVMPVPNPRKQYAASTNKKGSLVQSTPEASILTEGAKTAMPLRPIQSVRHCADAAARRYPTTPAGKMRAMPSSWSPCSCSSYILRRRPGLVYSWLGRRKASGIDSHQVSKPEQVSAGLGAGWQGY